MKRLTALLTAAAMLSSPITVGAIGTEQAEGFAQGIVAYEKQLNGISPKDSLLSGEIAENGGSESSDWAAIGAVRFGLEEDTAEYLAEWAKNMGEKDMDNAKTTEISRAALTALCIGADPTDVSGADLIESIYMRPQEVIDAQGLNGWVWALIAIDSYDWKAPEHPRTTRQDMLRNIIAAQNEDGGFSIEQGGSSDPDLTAMAVQALSPYRYSGEAEEVLDKAIGYLAEAPSGADSCETAAQTICALCCMGIDPDKDERFSELTETLISFANDDGGFAHQRGGDSSEMPSVQALIALCSLSRLRNGERSLYDMNEGAAQQPQRGSLEDIANAKELHTRPPSVGGTLSSSNEEKPSRRAVTAAAAALAGAAAVTGGILLSKRKERAE